MEQNSHKDARPKKVSRHLQKFKEKPIGLDIVKNKGLKNKGFFN